MWKPIVCGSCALGGGAAIRRRPASRSCACSCDRRRRRPRSDTAPSPASPFSQISRSKRSHCICAAVRARHEEPPLVAGQILPLDPAAAGDGRRRDQEGLAAPAEGAGPRLGQRDRITLALDVAGIGVHLVQEQEPRRHGAQPDRAVGAGQHQDAAGEFLRQHGVAAVAGAGRRHPLPQRRRLLQQRVDALAAEALGQFHGRLHRQHRRRHVVHDVAEPVVAALRARPTCAPFMNTTRRAGCTADSASMTSRR